MCVCVRVRERERERRAMDDLTLAQLTNATASFDDLIENGAPSPALRFPSPNIGNAARVNATVFNPATGEEASVPNVVYEIRADGSPPRRAYWIGRKLKRAIYGCVRSCTVLKLHDPGQWSGSGGNDVWEVTAEMAAVKIMDWNVVHQLRGRHMEDPLKEVAAMQFIARDGPHPNVLQTLDVLKDDQYLYSFMPFCSGGELFGFVEREGRFSEPVARFWFRQILNGLLHLQKMGVCHRDISLENILVDECTRSLIIDMGMCLRVPFTSDDGSVTDASEGTLRRLMSPQGQCGKPNYISPEVLLNSDPFDGFAIDLWAAGIILFIMLVGLPPFEWANRDDPRFLMITNGRLMSMLRQWRRPVSEEAGDLLQRMLREDPRDRLSLSEVMDHMWVVRDEAAPPPPGADEEWRR